MPLIDIIPDLKELSRQEKLKAIQFLAHELAQEDIQTEQIEHGKIYEIWSPYDAFSAEKILTKILQEHNESEKEI